MKRPFRMKLLSFLLVLAMMLMASAVAVSAEADTNSGKYVKDVYIAYGKDKATAEKWLKDNGWKPVGDLNEGKTSDAPGYENAVAVMGIKCTDNPNEAITDMATMFMKGDYTIADYDSLIEQKKTDVDEFINNFVPVLREYRDNYNGKGSEGGQKRAQMAHDLLNKFYDGDPKSEYAINDTGKPLGDLFLNKTKAEIGNEAYEALSAEQKLNVADLQQIILESSGPAVLIIEQALALAADTAEDSWLDRLDGLTGLALVHRIGEFAPEAKGQDLAPSAAMNLLAARFEDYAKILAAEWINVHEDILWFEQYCDEHDLWKDKDRGIVEGANLEQHFNALKEEDKTRYEKESKQFYNIFFYCYQLKDVVYFGEWGETLYDFFRPEDENADYSEEYTYFAPLAAALSDGQRAALEFIKLPILLKLGISSEAVTETDVPSVEEAFGNTDGEQPKSVSIYSGVDRSFFRKGVALTMDALAQTALGYYPYFDFQLGPLIIELVYNVDMALMTIQGIVSMIIDGNLPKEGNAAEHVISEITEQKDLITESFSQRSDSLSQKIDLFSDSGDSLSQGDDLLIKETIEETTEDLSGYVKEGNKYKSLATASRWMNGIGGALMVVAAALRSVQIYQFYHRTFSAIPVKILDKASTVSYTVDKNGNQIRLENFAQFVEYEVVRCNRQEVGIYKNAQGGVSDYKSWGCGSAADINADIGKQWLAMYVNRSPLKGNPILADSLKLQKGTDKTPDGCDRYLHMFAFDSPVKIDDTAYCYREDNKGMYLFWKGDETAFAESTSTGTNTSGKPASSASVFNAGYLALAGIGGLALGIFGTTLVVMPKLKKKKEASAK